MLTSSLHAVNADVIAARCAGEAGGRVLAQCRRAGVDAGEQRRQAVHEARGPLPAEVHSQPAGPGRRSAGHRHAHQHGRGEELDCRPPAQRSASTLSLSLSVRLCLCLKFEITFSYVYVIHLLSMVLKLYIDSF